MEYEEEEERVLTEEANEDKAKGDKEVENERELGAAAFSTQPV